ncbi:MAG: hypothetical protein KC766_04545 [Myxococcales bacterium]|nr:hypothetical protein [Myxococcales bacterium]
MKRLLLCLAGACCLHCVPQDTETKNHQDKATTAVVKPRRETPKKVVESRASEATKDLPLAGPYRDEFDRKLIGNEWRATSAAWQMENGRLCVERARNHPVWLKRRLPTNARIEFEATSYSPAGDIKAELWGNGFGSAAGTSYNDASSYLTIFGGWNNQFHVLARLDEHAANRPQVKLDPTSTDLRTSKVRQGETYRFKIERSDGKTVKWWVNETEILSYTDPQPLTGSGHDHFGFNDWDAKLCFDNLTITPL